MSDKAVYQYNLIHAAKDERLRRVLRRRFLATSSRHGLVLPEAVEDGGWLFCERCEEVLISGVNVEIRVKYLATTGDKAPRRRVLQYRCTGCKQCVERDVLVQQKEITKSVEKSSGKERAKKRKNNSLGQLLKKKQVTTKSLDLMDFMKM